MNRLQKANQYIQANKQKVTNRPLYHFAPEIGWMNDPNGFVFYKGDYHLFYQHNPYDIVWDNMHWGHAKTKDFVNWEHLPEALANDKAYDANGCFSGSAIEKDGQLYIMYTGHVDPNLGFDRDEPEISQTQCIAISRDGIHFEKYAKNPVIGREQLPEGYLICDFRDPKLLEVDGVYYCVLAVRNEKRRGEVLLFESKDLLEWRFHSSIYQTAYEENMLLECPDLFMVDGEYVLIFSEMPCDPSFSEEVPNRTAYVIGDMDFDLGRFSPKTKGLLDFGQTFYAPQSTEGENGERILIGWMHRWHATTPPKEYGFNGMMSIPRQLRIEDGQLVQRPYINREVFEPISSHEHVQLPLDFKDFTTGYIKMELSDQTKECAIQLNKNETHSTRISICLESNQLIVESDFGNSEPISIPHCFQGEDREKVVEVYLDRHSVELFINLGEKVVSFTAYDANKGSGLSIEGGIESLRRVVIKDFVIK